MVEKEGTFSSYLSKLALIVTAVSVLTFAIGCFIINVNLSSYQLQDFDLVKPRAVYVGLVFMLLLAANISIYVIVPDKMKEHRMNKVEIRRYNFIKCFVTAILLYMIAEFDFAFSEFCTYQIKGNTYNAKGYVILAIAISLIIRNQYINIENKEFWKRLKNHIKIKVICRAIVYYLPMTTLSALILLYLPVTEFLLIFLLQLTILAIITDYQANETEKATDEINYLVEGRFDVHLSNDDDPFDIMIKDVRKNLKAFFDRFEKPAFAILGLLAFLLIMYCYSYFCYPIISQSIGGGKLEKITYVAAKDTISGKKVYETESFVFVIKKDSTIVKLNWSDIDGILRQK